MEMLAEYQFTAYVRCVYSLFAMSMNWLFYLRGCVLYQVQPRVLIRVTDFEPKSST